MSLEAFLRTTPSKASASSQDPIVEAQYHSSNSAGVFFTINSWDGGAHVFGPAPGAAGASLVKGDTLAVAFLGGGVSSPWVLAVMTGANQALAAANNALERLDPNYVGPWLDLEMADHTWYGDPWQKPQIRLEGDFVRMRGLSKHALGAGDFPIAYLPDQRFYALNGANRHMNSVASHTTSNNNIMRLDVAQYGMIYGIQSASSSASNFYVSLNTRWSRLSPFNMATWVGNTSVPTPWFLFEATSTALSNTGAHWNPLRNYYYKGGEVAFDSFLRSGAWATELGSVPAYPGTPDSQGTRIFCAMNGAGGQRVDFVNSTGKLTVGAAGPNSNSGYMGLGGMEYYARTVAGRGPAPVIIGSGGSAPAFTNGYSNYAGGYITARYTKRGDVVWLDGLVNGAAGVSMFTLPPDCRPPADLLFKGATGYNGSTGRIDVKADGTVVSNPVFGAFTGWHSISGISFSVTP